VACFAALAAFLALVAPSLAVGFLVAAAFFGATGAPGAATAAACVATVVSEVFIVVPFLRDWRITFITLGTAEGKCGGADSCDEKAMARGAKERPREAFQLASRP